METREVVVVGGGPGGAAAATLLAQAGHDVLVLDRSAFPRRKPCAECINPAGVQMLRSLGALDAVRIAGGAPLLGWRVSGDDGRGFTGGFPAGVEGLAMERRVLDDVLLRHAAAAGAEVRTGARVTDLLRDAHGAVTGVRVRDDGGEHEIRARLVIGADGLRSLVVRRLGLLRRPPRLKKLALTAHVAGWEPREERGEMRVRGRGCLGIADVGGGRAIVSVVVDHARAREVAGDPGSYFDAALASYGLADAVRVDEPLASGPFDWPVRRAVADGALLVGDAAGYYDPLTGQGIYRALRGGALAADTAHAALRASDTSMAMLMPYERARRRAFAPGERMQRVVEAFVSRPAVLSGLSRRLSRRPALADALIRVTGDVNPPSSLWRPSFVLGLLF